MAKIRNPIVAGGNVNFDTMDSLLDELEDAVDVYKPISIIKLNNTTGNIINRSFDFNEIEDVTVSLNNIVLTKTESTASGANKNCSVSIPTGESELKFYAGEFNFISSALLGDYNSLITEVSLDNNYTSEASESQTRIVGILNIGTFRNCSNLTKIRIPSTMKYLPGSMFYNCSNINEVYTTHTLASWCNIFFNNYYANPIYYADNFYIDGINLKNETTLTIPNGVTKIEPFCFTNQTQLTQVNLPNTLLSLSGFDYCSNLSNISIPSSVTTIDEYVFYYSGITSLTIPGGVTTIGPYAFGYCSNLQTVTINEGVTTIKNYAFSYCNSLQTVTIPSTLNSIGTDNFVNSPNLQYNQYSTAYYLGNSNNNYVLLVKSLDTSATYCSVSSSCKIIYYRAFSNCTGLQTLIISDSVQTLCNPILSGCGSLSSLTLPFIGDIRKASNETPQYPLGRLFGTSSYTGGVQTTQYYYGSSLSDRTSMKYYIPSSLKSITLRANTVLYGAFMNCSNITAIYLSNSLTNIQGEAFFGCISLEKITIPSTVTYIGAGAFANTAGAMALTEMTFMHGPNDTLSLPTAGSNPMGMLRVKTARNMTIKHYGNTAVTDYDYSADNITATLTLLA